MRFTQNACGLMLVNLISLQKDAGAASKMLFDRILCDVPCR